jgi:DNA (cytosine-5)-methyltransferase 1
MINIVKPGSIHPEKPAPTIKENHGAPFVHPFEDRVGTPRECAAIQTFPNDYLFKGSKSSTLKQIGNAVPPELGSYVAEKLLEIY